MSIPKERPEQHDKGGSFIEMSKNEQLFWDVLIGLVALALIAGFIAFMVAVLL